MDLLILAVPVFTALSGFFALCDYSLRSFRRSQLEEFFGGEAGRRRLDRFDRNLTALRVTVSFCRVAANTALVASMLMLIAAPGFSGLWIVVALVAAFGIIALFGIAIPHAWALCASEKIIAGTFAVLLVLRYALFFVPDMMIALEVPICRLLGTEEKDDTDDEVAKQEILQAVTEGHAEGAVDPEEVEMIESVIEFGDTQTGEIMTPRTDIFALPADTPRDVAAQQIVEAGHSRVPLYEGDMDNIIGILYAKDLLWPVSSPNSPLREIMRKPYFVPETKPLDDLLREFKTRKVHLAVVLDEYGGTAGLVTIEDLLEEIVGDISDEYDLTEPALMTRINTAAAEIDGRMHIDDLNDAMGLAIPEDEDYDTAAGFVFSELGYIPEVGEELVSNGAKFTILAADERKITRLRVEVGETEEPDRL